MAVTPAPKKPKPSLVSRVLGVYTWVTSPDGRKDVGALVAAVTALYVAGHRAGLF